MTTFTDLGASAPITKALAKRDITEAFPIQVAAIPPALAGKDVCGRAPTGCGKTLAFGIPLMTATTGARPRRPRGLVLTPTRELATQVAEELRQLATNSRVGTYFGGTGYGPQLKSLRRGVDIAVACPGRLMDLLERNELTLDDVSMVVVDEADRMADMGFLPQVRKILDQTSEDRQTLLFSATLDGAVSALIKRYQHDPVTCEVPGDEQSSGDVAHSFLQVERTEKATRIAAFSTEHDSIVTFVRTKRGADRLTRRLQGAGVSAASIHGGRSQPQRDRALAAFRKGTVQILVATDVAARGIHVDNVDCVIHHDLAADDKDYIHRSGRTGRAGASGNVVSLISGDELAALTSLRRALKLEDAHIDPALEQMASSAAARNRGSRPNPRRNQQSRRPNSSGGDRRPGSRSRKHRSRSAHQRSTVSG